jgi:hypothetical protein
MVVARVYPASDPATVARPYNDEVGCYNSLYGNKCSITMMRLAVSLCDWPYLSLGAPRAPPCRLIKAPGVGNTMVPEQIQYGVLD